MSLKVEQKLDGFFFSESAPRVYTTGAYLVPMELSYKSKKRYVWVVDEFDDDTYNSDGVNCDPKLYSSNKSSLL